MLQKPLKTEIPQPHDGLPVGMSLQARQRRLRSQRLVFTQQALKTRIQAQPLGVIAVLVTCRDLVNPLAKHLLSLVINKIRVSPVVKNSPKLFRKSQLLIKLAQQQQTTVARNLAAVKIENNLRLKTEPELIMTLCSHRSSVFCLRLMW
jgi:hypothetical protein